MAEHIDRNSLNTNVRYRFDYVAKFLNFTKDDIACLNELAPIMFPHIPHIVESAYKKLYSFDITKQYFILRNECFQKFSSDEEPNGNLLLPQTEFRKDMLTMHLKRLFIQTDWNDRFLQYLSQIGEIHTESDHSEPTHIEYIHVNILFGYLEHLIIEILWSTNSLEKQKKCSSIRAVNKVFWIQNDFFTMHYGLAAKQRSSEKINSKKSSSNCLFQ